MSEKLFEKIIIIGIVMAYTAILVWMLVMPERKRFDKLQDRIDKQEHLTQYQGELLDSLAAIVYD